MAIFKEPRNPARPGIHPLLMLMGGLALTIPTCGLAHATPPAQDKGSRPIQSRPARRRHPRWEIRIMRGTPGGYIQVRENAVRGTPLPLGAGLGLSPLIRLRIGWSTPIGPRQRLVLHLDLSRFTGQQTFPHTIDFNGVGLLPHHPVYSDTPVVNDWELTALDRVHLASWFANRLRVDGELGFIYVGLTYMLSGTPVGATTPGQMSGSRTMEDFITQELPVPEIGLRVEGRLTPDWMIVGSILGGHLPDLYSLRNEGGKVFVSQTDREMDLGVRYRLNGTWWIELGAYTRYYMQHEISAQDGNYIRMREHGLYLGLTGRF